jgi:solute carrier family 13 (sodium-dependent dicarboxylate transporter), member 2/3/5
MVQKLGLWLGVLVAAILLVAGPPTGLTTAGWQVITLLVLMVTWWISEAVPVAVTALLPLALLPVLGIAKPGDAAAPYADPIIFLFIGGFILAISVERWGLHKRLALALIGRLGTQPHALVGGFLLTCALLSMWISNTATALMLMPIAVGVARALGDGGKADPAVATALVLAVAYAASIGGIGTPIGSPTNLVAMGYLEKQGLSIGFTQWMIMALPVMLVLLGLVWLTLSYSLKGSTHGKDVASLLAAQHQALGPMSTPERRILLLFGTVALAWILREPLSNLPGLGGLSDMSIAIIGAIALFIVPAGQDQQKLLDWTAAEKIPWGIALLFGGGLSMAAAMDSTGVTAWLGEALSGLGMLAPLLIIAILVAIVIFATEVASNTATLTAFLPVIGAIALASDINPLLLTFPATIAASLAFMMPIGTPPNAIAYGTGQVSLKQMMRTGLWLNIAAIIAVVALSEGLVPLILA